MATIPQWRSHKVVTADKVVGVKSRGDDEVWHLRCGEEVTVTAHLHSRVPAGVFPANGYYVRYEDGFESWSPVKAFEEGYTKVEG